MGVVLRCVFNIISTSLATLIGNWIGGQLRYYLTGEYLQTVRFVYKTHKGRTLTNSPVATKFYPGLLFSLVGKPRWLFALIGGVLAGGLIPDRFEHYWLEHVIEPLIVDRFLERDEQEHLQLPAIDG
jgi:hypothetical protein